MERVGQIGGELVKGDVAVEALPHESGGGIQDVDPAGADVDDQHVVVQPCGDD